MKKISILGSTGSIGTSTLEVVRHLGEGYEVIALSTRQNIDLLEQQIKEFRPKIVSVSDPQKAQELQKRLPSQEILTGIEGAIAVATHPETNLVISAMSGVIGLQPTVEAIRAGKNIGLANKEVLVSGGEFVMSLVKKHNVQLIPIDSEHSAIFQCLVGEDSQNIRRLILTASGGPFRDCTATQLEQVTVEQALKHPNWSMGAKVTIDSSTLMNKGLEVIEARWLFDIPSDQIQVVIHPQSIIHSMVEFNDGSIKAQLSEPSMLIPIQYALTYPQRKPGILPPFDFLQSEVLQFHLPDTVKFPCLALALNALKAGGSFPCTMNAANEVLVDRFLQGQIGWMGIGNKLEQLMSRHSSVNIGSIKDLFDIDQAAREEAATI
ncbi:MAG: 1-deoxy-D-xylulose 5-phosphate reductoisomerase [Chlamydiae bacterium]|nr:1-deoxy-D-xylulose 5-phosphate reductoisomerase [Chlamydiota bacterium]